MLTGLHRCEFLPKRSNRVHGIFVTHSHYDHALDVAYIAQKTGAPLFGSSSTLNLGRGTCIPDEHRNCFDNGPCIPEEKFNRFVRGEGMKIGAFEVVPVPSKHFAADSLMAFD